MQEEVPLTAENSARPAPRAPRPAAQQLPHEDLGVLRVREASTGVGLGRELSGRPAERHPAAAHFVSPVPPVSALLPAEPRPVPGQTALCARKRRQADLEACKGDPDQPEKFGEALR